MERRRLLAADISLSGGDLQIVDSAGSNDALTITTNASAFVISDTGGNTLTTSIAGASGDGSATVTVPFNLVDGVEVLVATGGGDDQITIGGAFAPSNDLDAATNEIGLILNGGSGTDTVNWNGASPT